MSIVIVRRPAILSQIAEMRTEFGDLIKKDNRSLELQSPVLRQQFEAIVRRLLEVE